jgi:hypothetical protein
MHSQLKAVRGSIATGKFLTAFALTLATVYLVNRLFTGSLSGDALMRSGFGEAWLKVRKDPGVIAMFISSWIWPWGAITLGLILGIPLCRSATWQRGRFGLWMPQFKAETLCCRWPISVALLAVGAVVGVTWALSFSGMDFYHRKQFYWRLDVIMLFALVLVLASSMQRGVVLLAKRIPKLAHAGVIATGVLLAALLAYHEYRIHWFRVNAVGQEYFLTKDAEALRPWLEEYGRTHQKYSLATISTELNYLCAYWTNADLMLPSGFPYHSLESNKQIRERTVDLLRLYNVEPKAWTKFAAPRENFFFHIAWRKSRAEAQGQSYLYHLYHRGFTLDSTENRNWRRNEIKNIARRLETSAEEPAVRPDVILIDEVSRTLGRPDLAGYQRAFKSGDLEAWVGEDAIVNKSRRDSQSNGKFSQVSR